MGWIFSWIAFGFVVLLVILRGQLQKGEERTVSLRGPLSITFCAAVAGVIAYLFGRSALGDPSASLLGFAVGVAGAFASGWVERIRSDQIYDRLIPIGLAAALVGWLRADSLSVTIYSWMGLCVGSALGAFVMYASRLHRLAAELTVSISVITALSLLGTYRGASHTAFAGEIFALTVIVSLLIVSLIDKRPAARTTFGPLLFILAGCSLAMRYFMLPTMAWLVVIGTVAALMIAWALPDDDSDVGFSFILGAILSVALATVGFAILRGFGIALVAMSSVIFLLVFGSRRGLLALSPLLFLALFRVFREYQPGVVRAVDIGQHNAMVGLLLGLLLALAPTFWGRTRRVDTTAAVAGALLAIGLALALSAGILVLGPSGNAGLIMGIAAAPIVAGLGGTRSLSVMVSAIGLGALTVIVHPWFGSLYELSRDEKAKMLGWIVAVGVVLFLFVALLSRRVRSGVEEKS